MPERRREKRRLKRLRLKYGITKPERFAFTEDISPKGLFVKTVSALAPGKRVKVELYAPDKSTIQLECCVMWIKRVPPGLIHLAKKGGMGLKITKFISGENMFMELCLRQSRPSDVSGETDGS